ncbi:MAG TPA: tetratricopeptide repeat protein [Phycisphaerales bacterium]|nr:tetratricopeptide repeat protein [Phycisphaerales bacterium]
MKRPPHRRPTRAAGRHDRRSAAEQADRLDRRAFALYESCPEAIADQISLLRRAVRFAPNDLYLLAKLGNRLWENRELDEAEVWYRRAAVAEPENWDGVGFCGAFLQCVYEGDEGLRMIETAAHHDPEGWAFKYGRALYKAGDLEGAIVQLRLALEIDPQNERAASLLAKLTEQPE